MDTQAEVKTVSIGGSSFRVHQNGYFNASSLCSHVNARLNNYIRNLRTQHFLRETASSSGTTSEQLLIVHQGRGPSWIHPIVVEHLLTWLSAVGIPKSVAGYVYAVTSPHLQAVKVGKWLGTSTSLRQRYVTTYGPELEVCCSWVSDCAEVENTMHCVLNPFARGGELFAKTAWTAACDIIVKLAKSD